MAIETHKQRRKPNPITMHHLNFDKAKGKRQAQVFGIRVYRKLMLQQIYVIEMCAVLNLEISGSHLPSCRSHIKA